MIIPLPQSPVHLTYCSNLHPIEQLTGLLEVGRSFWPRIADELKRRYAPTSTGTDLGIWLSKTASSELLSRPQRLAELAQTIEAFSGQALTANAFPMGDFHQDRVKENVYLPDWQDEARLSYSEDVARILAHLPHHGDYQSMSTSPGSFKSFAGVDIESIANHFVVLALSLHRLEGETGRRIVVAIEPEPGCTFETTDELVQFFEDCLLKGNSRHEEMIRRHIGACFDCCHQAIQFEEPADSLAKLRGAGVQVAKVQLSSALELEEPAANEDGLAMLASFAEDRYLHQVVAQRHDGSKDYFNDLPLYLEAARSRDDRAARIHFHVPVFLDKIGSLGTTQSCLESAIAEIVKHDSCAHLEIETYSWGVMPERRGKSPSADDLLADVLAEYDWVVNRLKSEPAQ